MDQLRTFLSGIGKEIGEIIHYAGISKRTGYLCLLLVVVSAALFRILTIDTPALDRTAWKEIDYIMISKNYFQENGRIFYPQVSWPAERPAVTAMELPVVPYVASRLYPVLGINAFSVRLTTLIAFLLLIIYTFKLVLREEGMVLALLAAFFSAFTPLFSPFRNFLFSEPALLFFSVFAIYQYAQWVDFHKRRNFWAFVLGFSMAISLKPTALYLLLPLFWIHYRKHQFRVTSGLGFIGTISLCMVVPALWYLHAYYLAENYMDVFGVFGGQFGGHDKFQTLNMLRNPAWYAGLLTHLRRLLLGLPGGLMFLLGVVMAVRRRTGYLFLAYLLAIISFFVIVAEGQLDAPYRQLTIVPPASFFLALGTVSFSVLIYRGMAWLFGTEHKRFARVLTVLLCAGLLFSLPLRRPHFLLPGDQDAPVHTANWILAEQIRKNAGPASRIIMSGEYTIHKGGIDASPVTYYYAGISGWTIQQGEWTRQIVDSLAGKGADLFGAINYRSESGLDDFVTAMRSRYEVLYENPEKQLLLLSLRPDQNKTELSHENRR